MYRGNTEWRNYRAKFLAINSECYACGEPATVVDHLVPHKGDVELFKKTDNHIPLCMQHHNFVSAKFDTKYVIGGTIEEKVTWLNGMRISIYKGTPKPVKVLARYEDEKEK